MDDPDADAKQSAVEARAADDEAKAAAQAAVAVGAAAAFEADAGYVLSRASRRPVVRSNPFYAPHLYAAVLGN